MVIAPRFNQAGAFSEGLAAVETRVRVVGNQVVDIAWGFIGKSGALKIQDKYELAGSSSEGLAPVATKLGKWGYIDRNGKMAIPPGFVQASGFSDGFAAVCSDDCVYIDRSGSPVLTGFNSYWPFSDGLTVIGFEAPQHYIDKKGRVIANYSE